MHRLTEIIIGCSYQVANTLGCGFLEKVYENAMAHELREAVLRVEQTKPLPVYYDGIGVGNYEADLLVEGRIILELKTVRAFDNVHSAQCLNYLKATGLRLCLLINFGNPRVEMKRIVR